MEEKELRDMKLHERKQIDNQFEIIRVVGGWIYKYCDLGAAIIFVPDNTYIYDLIAEIQTTVQFVRNKF